MEKPKQLNDKDYHEDNDYDHYIFEEAMTTIFGKDVFDWKHQLGKD